MNRINHVVARDMVRAMRDHTWRDGFDRNSSHATGRYCDYEFGLSVDFDETSARVWAEELGIVALKTLAEHPDTPADVAEWLRGIVACCDEWLPDSDLTP